MDTTYTIFIHDEDTGDDIVYREEVDADDLDGLCAQAEAEGYYCYSRPSE